MTGRQRVALADPPDHLSGFPSAAMGGQDWFRAHAAGNSPWWFAHDGHGRFDLPLPHGTCYLGSSVEVAVRERLGETLSRAGMVSMQEVERMVVSRLRSDGTLADATHPAAADFGVTRELGTLTPYDLPRRWARAMHAAGFHGLLSWPRFSVDATHRAAALFGDAGVDDDRPADPTPMSGREAADLARIRVVGVPRTLPTVSPGQAEP